MKILAVDQARHGAWAIFDYEEKKLLAYDSFSFDNRKYKFEQAVLQIETLIDSVINAHGIDAVFIEDIQQRKSVKSFKKLAQLQGVLINLFEKNNFHYGIVAPSQWQNFCGARGRTEKERKAGKKSKDPDANKTTKELSIQRVKELYGVETENDNVADAILIAHYVVNKIDLSKEN